MARPYTEKAIKLLTISAVCWIPIIIMQFFCLYSIPFAIWNIVMTVKGFKNISAFKKDPVVMVRTYQETDYWWILFAVLNGIFGALIGVIGVIVELG